MASADHTARLASDIAPLLTQGDTLLLRGDIGAGKTHFARSVIQNRLTAADRLEDVPSPTYTLVQTYDDGVSEIWHADLYRLTDISEISELGLEDAFDQAICLVEWPELLGQISPDGALKIGFETGRNAGIRKLRFEGNSARWQKILPILSSVNREQV